MANIPLGTGDWELRSEDISRVRVRNMYLIENPSAVDGISRITRPSLAPYKDIDLGPVTALWQQSGAIGDKWLIVSDSILYTQDTDGTVTEIGVVPGTGYCDFAATKSRVIFACDGTAYSTDGATLTTVNMPEGLSVESVASINGYFILTVKDGDKFFWIDPLEIDPDPLDFATAERSPDPLKAVRVIFDEIWFCGIDGPEVWSTTADSEAPFQRINGRVYSEGCETFATNVAVLKNSLPALIWVTPNRSVVLAQGQVKRISNPSVEELLAGTSNLRAWPFRTKKSDFYVLTTADFTLVFNIQRDEWYRWDSYDYAFWRAHLGTQIGVDVYAADAILGKIWKLETDGFDNVDTPIVKELTGVVLNPGNPQPCFSVNIRVNSGWVGDYRQPEPLELFVSDDLGVTWSTPSQEATGAAGKYKTDVQYRSLGSISRPGRAFRFRHTDLSRLRIDGATLNEGM